MSNGQGGLSRSNAPSLMCHEKTSFEGALAIREGAFERLNPPWQRFTVIQRKGSIQSNGLVEIRSKIGPLSFKWVVKHSDYIDGTYIETLRFQELFHRGLILICLRQLDHLLAY